MPYFLLCRMIEESNYMNPYANKEDDKKKGKEISMAELAQMSGVEIVK